MKKAKSSQHLYVSWHKHAGKWEARVQKDKMHLGFHRTEEAAAAAVEQYLRQVVAEVLPSSLPCLGNCCNEGRPSYMQALGVS